MAFLGPDRLATVGHDGALILWDPGPRRPGGTDAEGANQRVEVTVTDQTKPTIGIQARVVHDVVTEDGQLIEDTYDWYAQDARDNICTWARTPRSTRAARWSAPRGPGGPAWTAPSPAFCGLLIPKRDLAYRQEDLKGEAEDAAQVLSTDMRVKVPYGRFEHVLVTKDWTPLEPDLLEHKFYAPGVGPVLAITVKGGSSKAELLRFQPARCAWSPPAG